MDELVFDWWGKGPSVQVAVVARETLTKRKASRRDQAPLRSGVLRGDPRAWQLGQGTLVRPDRAHPTILTEGEKVERDQNQTIHIVGRSAKPSAAAPADETPPLSNRPRSRPNRLPRQTAAVPTDRSCRCAGAFAQTRPLQARRRFATLPDVSGFAASRRRAGEERGRCESRKAFACETTSPPHSG